MKITDLEWILFDLDGVLVDTCDLHYKALNQALLDITGSCIPQEDHDNKFNGLPTIVKLSKLNIPSGLAQEISARKQFYTHKAILTNIEVSPSKIELHKFLIDHGIKTACVTNCSRKSSVDLLTKSGQLEYMKFIITNEDVINNKPAPDCYNKAFELGQIDPLKCLCVEDSHKGCQAVLSSKAHYLWKVKDSNDVTIENLLNYIKIA